MPIVRWVVPWVLGASVACGAAGSGGETGGDPSAARGRAPQGHVLFQGPTDPDYLAMEYEPDGIQVDERYVYWTAQSVARSVPRTFRLYRAPWSGGATAELANASWIQPFLAPQDIGAPDVYYFRLFPSLDVPTSIFRVTVDDVGAPAASQEIFHAAVTDVDAPHFGPTLLFALHAGAVYFSDSARVVWSVPVDGSAAAQRVFDPATIVRGRGDGTHPSVSGLAVNDRGVFVMLSEQTGPAPTDREDVGLYLAPWTELDRPWLLQDGAVLPQGHAGFRLRGDKVVFGAPGAVAWRTVDDPTLHVVTTGQRIAWFDVCGPWLVATSTDETGARGTVQAFCLAADASSPSPGCDDRGVTLATAVRPLGLACNGARVAWFSRPVSDDPPSESYGVRWASLPPGR